MIYDRLDDEIRSNYLYNGTLKREPGIPTLECFRVMYGNKYNLPWDNNLFRLFQAHGQDFSCNRIANDTESEEIVEIFNEMQAYGCHHICREAFIFSQMVYDLRWELLWGYADVYQEKEYVCTIMHSFLVRTMFGEKTIFDPSHLRERFLRSRVTLRNHCGIKLTIEVLKEIPYTEDKPGFTRNHIGNITQTILNSPEKTDWFIKKLGPPKNRIQPVSSF